MSKVRDNPAEHRFELAIEGSDEPAVNDRDQELVTRLAPDSTGTILKELPSLPTRQATLEAIEVRRMVSAHLFDNRNAAAGVELSNGFKAGAFCLVLGN